MGPKFNAWCPYKKGRGHRYTQGRGHISIEADWSDAVIIQGTLRITGSQQKLGRDRAKFSPNP